jgi:shikimate dehydrogenase
MIARLADQQGVGGGRMHAEVLVGLVGRGIGRSRSPQMHEREGERLGLAYRYLRIDFDELGLADDALLAVLDAAAGLGFAGLNVTHPYKQQVIAHLDDLAPEAASIGAVNTVVLGAGRRVGHNTDAWGFAESFRAGLANAALDDVVQFGAGGGGAAVGYAVLQLGARHLNISDLDASRAESLSERLSQRFGRVAATVSDPAAALRGAAGVINATPIGMEKYPGLPFPSDGLSPGQWVADIVYFPAETELLRRARAIGCRTLSGAGMAIFQAIKAFELFTGITPDRGAMAEHFEAAA